MRFRSWMSSRVKLAYRTGHLCSPIWNVIRTIKPPNLEAALCRSMETRKTCTLSTAWMPLIDVGVERVRSTLSIADVKDL